jgi:putative N6-adenine-specific DNA methylase
MDGMCGSGTLLIEAALFAKNIPPQINRTYFGFMGWTNFNLNLWEQIQSEAMAAIVPLDGQIIGNDAVFKVTEIAKSNVAKMNLQNDIFITNKRFEEQRPPEGGGILIMNPPYGERLEIEEINQFYRMIGDTLKNKFEGFDAWIISSNKEALKHMKLAASKRMVVWNGPLECKFHKFEMYKGSKRQPKDAIPSNE